MKQFPEGGWANQESGLPQSAGAETRILFRSQHVVDFLRQLCHFLEILLEGGVCAGQNAAVALARHFGLCLLMHAGIIRRPLRNA